MGLKASMKILVADDMSSMRSMIKSILKKVGFKNITEAEDGEAAFSMIEEAHSNGEPFEFIISDWDMPKMSGLDLVKKLREDDRFISLPFLMVTAEAEQGNIVIAVKAGVNNVIVKPFNEAILKEKISKILN